MVTMGVGRTLAYLLIDVFSRWKFIQICCAHFDTSRLFALVECDVLLFAARCWNYKCCFRAGYIQIQTVVCNVIVFACLPIEWSVNATALELLLLNCKTKFMIAWIHVFQIFKMSINIFTCFWNVSKTSVGNSLLPYSFWIECFTFDPTIFSSWSWLR